MNGVIQIITKACRCSDIRIQLSLHQSLNQYKSSTNYFKNIGRCPEDRIWWISFTILLSLKKTQTNTHTCVCLVLNTNIKQIHGQWTLEIVKFLISVISLKKVLNGSDRYWVHVFLACEQAIWKTWGKMVIPTRTECPTV